MTSSRIRSVSGRNKTYDGTVPVPTENGVVYVARCPEHGLHGCRQECFVCGGPVEQVPMRPLGSANRQAVSNEERAALFRAFWSRLTSEGDPDLIINKFQVAFRAGFDAALDQVSSDV